METNKRYPLTTGNMPPKNTQLIVRGTHLGGSFTPADGGGVYATYHGLVNGHPAFKGRTSDYGFAVKSSDVTWERA